MIKSYRYVNISTTVVIFITECIWFQVLNDNSPYIGLFKDKIIVFMIHTHNSVIDRKSQKLVLLTENIMIINQINQSILLKEADKSFKKVKVQLDLYEASTFTNQLIIHWIYAFLMLLAAILINQ